MSDDVTQAASAGAAEPKKGLLASPTGRIVAILVGLGALGIIVGIVFLLVITLFGGDSEAPGKVQKPPASSQSASTTETVAPKTPATEIANADVFTFRNIFEPLLSEATSATVTPTSTGTTDTATPMEPGVLYFQNVLGYGDGTVKGLFFYNGSRYELGPGEGIPGTPWQVLRISSNGTAIMLYGDVQVTLSIGQGIRK